MRDPKLYVRRVLAEMLRTELNGDNFGKLSGWMFGGLERPDDDKMIVAVTREIRTLIKRLDK